MKLLGCFCSDFHVKSRIVGCRRSLSPILSGLMMVKMIETFLRKRLNVTTDVLTLLKESYQTFLQTGLDEYL